MPRLSLKKYIATYSVIDSQIEVTINAFKKRMIGLAFGNELLEAFFVLAIANVAYFFRNNDLSC